MAAVTAAAARVRLKHQQLIAAEKKAAAAEQKKVWALLKQHDSNGSGQLEKEQLRSLLVGLNGGADVPADAVDLVFDEASRQSSGSVPGGYND